jgi:large subunit ribosomal protein L10e
MAKLRKGISYSRFKRPYTRKSKFRKKAYIRAVPAVKVAKFETGNLQKKWEYVVELKAKSFAQVRHNALESARKSSNRWLETKLGKDGYKLRVRVYPHHVLRENPLAAGAGADRMSTGMAHNYGKAIGLAAQVKKGQCMVDIGVNESGLAVGKEAAKRAMHKMPCQCAIVVRKTSN